MSNNTTEMIPVRLIIAPKTGGKLSDKTLDLLADSMRVDGMLHPLMVRPHPDRPGFYILVAGRQRFLRHVQGAEERGGRVQSPSRHGRG
jgi:ParB-like nuclease domain